MLDADGQPRLADAPTPAEPMRVLACGLCGSDVEKIGVPTGGLFAGVDNCYHARCDRLGAVDLILLKRLASAAAFGVASIAPIRAG